VKLLGDVSILYGEESEEFDYLCDKHGCRLSSDKELFCPECRAEEEAELNAERQFEYEVNEVDAFIESSFCQWSEGKSNGNKFTAVTCKMPWWA